MAEGRDLKQMGEEDLIQYSSELKKQMMALREQRLAIQDEISERAAEREIAIKLGRMTAPEKAKLAQMVQAGGLETGEAVGTPQAE